ncbi:hypothetical protein CLOM_g8881 [Closterium sp. NIES-68]|nr:hypothetical protein CLOM_g8881 [Closterium sp. NIES-68]
MAAGAASVGGGFSPMAELLAMDDEEGDAEGEAGGFGAVSAPGGPVAAGPSFGRSSSMSGGGGGSGGGGRGGGSSGGADASPQMRGHASPTAAGHVVPMMRDSLQQQKQQQEQQRKMMQRNGPPPSFSSLASETKSASSRASSLGNGHRHAAWARAAESKQAPGHHGGEPGRS